jgi:hypothetical protein
VRNFTDSASAGTLTAEFILERSNEAKVKSSALPGLSYMAHRHYMYDVDGKVTQLVLRKQHSIGPGKIFTAAAMAKMWDGAEQGPTGVRSAPVVVPVASTEPLAPQLPVVPGALSKDALKRKRKDQQSTLVLHVNSNAQLP